MSKNKKLEQSKELLKALGLPQSQLNDRSAWVFLALANIRPNDSWNSVQAPLLPTVTIMQFIREHYGKDYKPNTRETIRRQTLHQFEQAMIICKRQLKHRFKIFFSVIPESRKSWRVSALDFLDMWDPVFVKVC